MASVNKFHIAVGMRVLDTNGRKNLLGTVMELTRAQLPDEQAEYAKVCYDVFWRRDAWVSTSWLNPLASCIPAVPEVAVTRPDTINEPCEVCGKLKRECDYLRHTYLCEWPTLHGEEISTENFKILTIGKQEISGLPSPPHREKK